MRSQRKHKDGHAGFWTSGLQNHKKMNVFCFKLSYLWSLVLASSMAPHSSTRLENPMDGGAWWAAVHGVAEGQTRLSNFTFTFTSHFPPLKKEMATHSSVLAWRIPGTGEPIYGVAQSQTRLK